MKVKMRAISGAILALVLTGAGVSQINPAGKKDRAVSDGQRLIGAWRLKSMSGPDGKPMITGVPTGILIYTRDGHMSVQLMYPKSAATVSNEYVQNGYEASFGSYDVNEATHTITHHVQGSNTGDRLAGKDLPRIYRFTVDGDLVIRPARPDEHWSVTWKHY